VSQDRLPPASPASGVQCEVRRSLLGPRDARHRLTVRAPRAVSETCRWTWALRQAQGERASDPFALMVSLSNHRALW